MKMTKTLSVLMAGLMACAAQATDYYVSTKGKDTNDGLSAETAFATIDKAVITVRKAGDVIHVQPGTYETTLGTYDSDVNSKWGPNLCVKLIGEGATRDDVILKSHGYHRTLRMAAGSWVENVTLEGEPYSKADNGGVIEISGGVLTNCVVRNGTTTGFGGNLYMTGGIAVDCVISNGFIKSTHNQWDGPKGVNVCLNGAAKLIRCHLSGGDTTVKDDGKLYYERGSVLFNNSSAQVENCLIEGSSCGGVIFQSSGHIYNSTIVDNKCYGLWSWDVDKCIVNCVIYGNIGADGGGKEWAGNSPTKANDVFLNNAISANKGALDGTYDTLRIIDENAFAGYANKDYAPSSEGALVDAGGADPRGAEASTLDLAGNPRMSGTIDIGCYEYQKRVMTVRIVSVAYSSIWAPSTVTFTHTTENSASPENMVFTYDFGDRSANETTAELSIDHAYAQPGVYTVKITATNAQKGEAAEMVYEGYVRVASSTVYVQPGNAAAKYPYATPETGYASLATAMSEAYDGYTLYLGEGTYESAGQISVSKALTIVGMGKTPEAVVLRNTADYQRTIELTKAGALLANVTVENGRVKNQYGANLRIAGGACVSNCVIRGGLAVADGGNAAGAGVALGKSNSTITHCVISNNVVQGTSYEGAYAGGAVFIEYEAQNIRLSNLLIAGNRYAPSDENKSGTAGVRYGGANNSTTMENCTIVANEVVGSLPDASAAVYCTSWYVNFFNNIFVGNRETQKDSGKYTSVKFDFNGDNGYKYMYNLTDDVLIGGSANKSVGNKVASATSLFKDFAHGDFTLKPGCAACNAGTTTDLALKPSVDLAGNPRIFDSTDKARIDMGCYECQKKLGFAIIVR